MPVDFTPRTAGCTTSTHAATLTVPGSFGYAIAGTLPRTCRIALRVSFADHTRGCGLVLRVSDDGESGYYLRLEPDRHRLVFDSWPRPGDLPFMVELERPLDLRPGQPLELVVFVDGTVCEVYAAGTTAMSARLYDLPRGSWGVDALDEGVGEAPLEDHNAQSYGSWGVFVAEGVATFDQVTLAVP